MESVSSASATYRIVQLDGLGIYRIEKYTKRWFRNAYYWKTMWFTRWGCCAYGGDDWAEADFASFEEVNRQLSRLLAEDYEQAQRERNNWRPISDTARTSR